MTHTVTEVITEQPSTLQVTSKGLQLHCTGDKSLLQL